MLRCLLATAAAEALDVERLLWVSKPIVTVPYSFKSYITVNEADDYVRGVLRRMGPIEFTMNFVSESEQKEWWRRVHDTY